MKLSGENIQKHLEKSYMIWKSYMFNLKKGTLKFLLNSCLDTLPTKSNLLQWGKSASDLCRLCLQAGAKLQGIEDKKLQTIFRMAARLHYTKKDILGGTTILLNISLI